jgi:hypothetical protein
LTPDGCGSHPHRTGATFVRAHTTPTRPYEGICPLEPLSRAPMMMRRVLMLFQDTHLVCAYCPL